VSETSSREPYAGSFNPTDANFVAGISIYSDGSRPWGEQSERHLDLWSIDQHSLGAQTGDPNRSTSELAP